jgi:hypothetical protein
MPIPVSCRATIALLFAGALHAQPAKCPADSARAPQSLPATIPIELHNNHVTLRVCRDTTPLFFVLDTGAGNTIYDLGVAKSLGVQLGAPFRAHGGGAGTVAGAQVRGESVVIPGASVSVPVTTAIDFSGITSAEGGRMQGILGADFIARFVVAIDYARRELRLYDRANFSYDGPGTSVPITLAGAFVYTRGSIELADGARVTGTFVVDVGSSLPLALAKPFVETHRLRDRIGRTVRRPSGRGVGGPSVANVGRLATLRIGTVEIARPVVHMYGDSAGVFSGSSLGDGNIGSDILRRFTVFFDYGGGRMILEPHAGTSEPFETDMSGVQLAATGASASLTVEFVLAESAAAEAGIQKGDVVVAVNGSPVSAGMLEELKRKLRREGERMTFTLRRNGSDVKVEFITRRII